MGRFRKNILITAGILLAGFAISGLSYVRLADTERRSMEEAFQIAAEERFATFQEVIGLDFNILVGLRGLFNASDEVDRYEFLVFTNSYFAEGSVFKFLAWAPIVPLDQLNGFFDELRYEGYDVPDLKRPRDLATQTETGKEFLHYPVKYIEPSSRFKHFLGLDLGPIAAEALEAARITNRLTLTGRIRLSDSDYADHVILAILPVHQKNIFSQQPPRHYENTQGYVFGAIVLDTVFNSALQLLKPQGLNSYIYDVTAGKPEFLYGHYSRLMEIPEHAIPDTPFERLADESLMTSFDWSIGGRRWRMAVTATDAFISRHRYWESLYFLILGCAITIITALLFYRSFRHSDQIEKTVEGRTRELEAAKKDLEGKVRIISEQNDCLENTKKATLNILEDLDESKKELERVNARLAQQKTDLEKVNLELDRFTYTASHDLRAPLRAISSFAAFLVEDYRDKLDEEGQDYIMEIQKGAARMTRLIDDLLSLSRISRIRNPYEVVELNNLVQSISERIDFDIQENNVDMQVQADLPTVTCDRIKMEEVFLNLINNAIKFSSKDNSQRPVVRVGGRKVEGGYELYVADNGIGIDPQFHDQVFDLFRRLQKDKDYDGTGAGLSIVKRIIEDHQGRVWVESELGKGAKFCFFIPDTLKANQVPHSSYDMADIPDFMGEI